MPESEDWPQGHPEAPRRERETDRRTGSAAAANRINQQTKWVDLQVTQAIARGEFDDLPHAGKPIDDLLGTEDDPEWWVKKLVEREKIAVLPPSIQLRKDDAELDDLIAGQASEREARRLVEEFNERVIAARYGTPEGPPLITMPRDVEETLARWRERRAERAAALRAEAATEQQRPTRRRWFRRRR